MLPKRYKPKRNRPLALLKVAACVPCERCEEELHVWDAWEADPPDSVLGKRYWFFYHTEQAGPPYKCLPSNWPLGHMPRLGDVYDVARKIDFGCRSIEEYLAEAKASNMKGILGELATDD